jgi:hypothetical protein
VRLSQPGGPGTGVVVGNGSLIASHEYYNIASINPCASGLGTGPWGGLCFSDTTFLFDQVLAPAGSLPFHFVAGGTTLSSGPYPVPPGLVAEVICADVTGGTLGCLASPIQYTVN